MDDALLNTPPLTAYVIVRVLPGHRVGFVGDTVTCAGSWTPLHWLGWLPESYTL